MEHQIELILLGILGTGKILNILPTKTNCGTSLPACTLGCQTHIAVLFTSDVLGVATCHLTSSDMAKLFSSLFKDLRALSLSNIEFFQHGTSSTHAKFHQSFVMLFEHLDRYVRSIRQVIWT